MADVGFTAGPDPTDAARQAGLCHSPVWQLWPQALDRCFGGATVNRRVAASSRKSAKDSPDRRRKSVSESAPAFEGGDEVGVTL